MLRSKTKTVYASATSRPYRLSGQPTVLEHVGSSDTPSQGQLDHATSLFKPFCS